MPTSQNGQTHSNNSLAVATGSIYTESKTKHLKSQYEKIWTHNRQYHTSFIRH